VLTLVGWALGSDALTAMGTGYIPMAPNTALLFALLGSAVLVREIWPASRVMHRAVAVAALLSAVVAGVTLIGFVIGLNIDDGLFRTTRMLGAVPMGRISPVTAFCFLLAGVSLLLLECQARTGAAIPGILITLVGAVCLMGYWFGTPLLYGGTVIPVALPTSLALVALGVGLTVAAGPDAWPLNTLIGPSTRARLLRALLPTVVLVALINEWITAILHEHTDPDVVLASAMTAILFLLVVGFVISRVSGAIGDAIDRAQAERKQAENALREREHLMRLVTENVPAMIAYFNAELRCRFANTAYCEFHHLDPQGVIGKTLREITGEDTYRVISPSIDRVKEGKPVKLRRQERTATGEIRHIEIHRVPDMSPEGAFLGYYAMVLDITERVRAEEAIFKLAAIVENSGDAIIGRDLDGRIVSWNAAAERLYGYTAAEAIGQHTFLITPPELRPEIERTRKLIRQGEPVPIHEGVGLTKDGRRIDVSLSRFPIKDDRGNIIGAATFARDITERKLAEEARNQLEAQLRESQKLEAIGTLAGGIAHDFNNILGAIIGNAALAQRDVGAGHRALVSLEEIYSASQRAKNLVQQILAFSRKQPQQLLIHPLRAVVEDAIKLLRATLPAGVEITATISDSPLYVQADATQIEQVLLNLCTNAWHAMEGRAGRIGIAIDAVVLDAAALRTLPGLQPGRHAHIRISDNGKGMDAATQARVFEPFFTTKPVGQGTGLGLSVVHGIVNAHHGAITLQSVTGEGTTFDIYMPAVAAPRAEVLPEPAAPSTARSSGQHVLYVDDDEAMVFLVTRMLEGLGYRVSGYELAMEGLAAVRAAPGDFDLAVTDFNMPGLSGLEVAQELARIRPDLPVVIISGYITDELRAKAPQAGVRHLVYKPNTVDELCEVIQRLLTTGSSAASDLSSHETMV
jgi:PAS domain S-box-containing protein